MNLYGTVTTTAAVPGTYMVTYSTGGPPEDNGLAGVREPRRPLPDPSGSTEYAELPTT